MQKKKKLSVLIEIHVLAADNKCCHPDCPQETSGICYLSVRDASRTTCGETLAMHDETLEFVRTTYCRRVARAWA